ncbi:MAG TPA: hypothetical protein VKY85_00745 [Candidatus Angelobacter sp.]|nr:hypothetical protein [Candidatus Angelobacter sp.]
MAQKPLTRRHRNRTSRFASEFLRKTQAVNEACFKLEDNSVSQHSVLDFFRLRGLRDPYPQAGRLAEQFACQNHKLFALLNVRVDHFLDGNDVKLRFQSGNTVGAIPLLSPTSAAPDYGLIVRPRFPWSGIGLMLGHMGWRITPIPLKLPLLRRSERQVPLWVLSSMILVRLKALLDNLNRRFDIVREIRNAPRGLVHWSDYATQHMSKGQFAHIPCTFPDLRDDRLLKGAIRYSLERHLRALESQREYGSLIHGLIDLYQQTLHRVRDVPPHEPSPRTVAMWLQRPLKAEHFADGIQAIEWTVEERGLAGLSDLEGIPWIMPMEQFFEAWVETVFDRVARQLGAELKVGRRRETTRALHWEPPYAGSQKSLAPDLWLEWHSTTLIVDAKYKRHWEEMQIHSWSEMDEQLKEQHRSDLFQILAYANLARTTRKIVCLVYPCSPENWTYLSEKGHLIRKAQVTLGSHALHIWLTAIPMATGVENVTVPITEALSSLIRI